MDILYCVRSERYMRNINCLKIKSLELFIVQFLNKKMKLFTKGCIGGLQLNNRIIMAPMNVGGNNESDGCLSERGIDYFVQRAKGGVGLIVTGAVRVTREFERDKDTVPLWMLFADHMIHTKWINELSERCHDYGTKVCIQLTAGGGRQAGRYAQEHNLAIGPSENPCHYPPFQNTRPMTKEEISKMVLTFENAARIVKNAGADAIQLHGHEGYLMDQFTSPLWNRRQDEYGGLLENRLRFSKELIEAVKRGAGKDFPVIYRYGLSHFIEGGRSIEEGLGMAALLESYGVDALDIDAGCYENWYLPHPPTTIECGSFAYLAELARKHVSIPIISSGRIGYPEIAESILEKNQADFICLGRPLIADPEWPNKTKSNNRDDIRPCLACHEGCLKRIMLHKSLSCAVNPLAGNEKYLQVIKSSQKKKIIVIGGGVAGMVSAITLYERGHDVTLYEKENELGGNFQLKYIPHFKNDYRKYIEYLIKQIKKTEVKVLLNTFVEITSFLDNEVDAIFNAVGAQFKMPIINGLNEESAINPLNLYEDRDFSGKIILIVGGGLIGVEAAINVASHGGKPIIVELTDSLAKTSYRANRDHLLVLLDKYKIPILTNTKIENIQANCAQCRNVITDEFMEIEFSNISICAGMESNRVELEDDDKVITIGDADTVDNVMYAVWTAFRKARLV